MRTLIRPTLVSFLLLSLLTGMLYPAIVTGGAQALFPAQASGSLIASSAIRSLAPLGTTHPSSLIGQSFTDPKYFWSRPSATGPVPYNSAASSGSNLGPTNPVLDSLIAARTAALKAVDPANTLPVPVDLVTASGSGLDPHISPEGAEYQVSRIARIRAMPVAAVRGLVQGATSGRQLAILGEPVVNVVQLNLALDAWRPAP
jgi:potassium-transporting ATPase KdpC subunit